MLQWEPRHHSFRKRQHCCSRPDSWQCQTSVHCLRRRNVWYSRPTLREHTCQVFPIPAGQNQLHVAPSPAAARIRSRPPRLPANRHCTCKNGVLCCTVQFSLQTSGYLASRLRLRALKVSARHHTKHGQSCKTTPQVLVVRTRKAALLLAHLEWCSMRVPAWGDASQQAPHKFVRLILTCSTPCCKAHARHARCYHGAIPDHIGTQQKMSRDMFGSRLGPHDVQ